MQRRTKTAWLIEWSWFGEHAKAERPFIAVLDGRLGRTLVARLIESIYLLNTTSRSEQITIVSQGNSPIRSADISKNGREITCGENPFIKARRVRVEILAAIDP